MRGTRYDVQSGPIQILDTKTIKIFGFIFQGDKAPGDLVYFLKILKKAFFKKLQKFFRNFYSKIFLKTWTQIPRQKTQIITLKKFFFFLKIKVRRLTVFNTADD